MTTANQPRLPDWIETGSTAPVEREPIMGVREEARILAGTVEVFRRHFPDEWEQLRLCPLQHGLETMGEKLRSYRPLPPE